MGLSRSTNFPVCSSFLLFSHEHIGGIYSGQSLGPPCQGRGISAPGSAVCASDTEVLVGAKAAERAGLGGARRGSVLGGRDPPSEPEMIISLFALSYASFQSRPPVQKERGSGKGSKWILEVSRCSSREAGDLGPDPAAGQGVEGQPGALTWSPCERERDRLWRGLSEWARAYPMTGPVSRPHK